MPGPSPLPDAASLRVLLTRARSARTADEAKAVLSDVAEYAAAKSLMGFAMIDVHRPQWDDFETVAIAGPEHVREALIDTTTQWSFWASKLHPRFRRGAVHHVGPGEKPGAELDGPWQPGEVLFCTLQRSGGDILGLLRAGAPLSGERPTDEQLEALALCAEFATTAIEAVLLNRAIAGSRAAFDGLAETASRAPDRRAAASSITDVCRQVQAGLGFGRVAVLAAEGTGLLRPVATVGWDEGSALLDHPWLSLAQLPLLFAGPYQRHGCALLERSDVVQLLDLRVPVPICRRNGDGPYAWRDHWLLVPLTDAAGRTIGILWPDEPADRLLPDRERLAALRVFAGQAAAALALSGHEGAATTQDILTGLPTRGTLADRLSHALRREQRSGTGVAVIFLDLDRFREINDAGGHSAGDALLQRIAARIDDTLRPSDTVARFGGDEFVIVCEDVGGTEQALEVAERLRAAIASPAEVEGRTMTVTASIGVAVAGQTATEADALLQAADRAMYEVKASGRDATRLASPGTSWP
ncbi:MAG: GGDEF domain-containing protein [Baekduia sp.]